MPDLPCRLRRECPDALGKLKESIPRDRVLPFQRVLPPECVFGEDQDVFVHIPERRVGSGLPASPCGGGTCAGRLIPDDLASHQKSEFDHVFGDECVKRDVWLPAEVCNVDTGASARHKDSMNLTPYSLQKFPVVFESQVLVVLFSDVVRRRGYHQMDAAIWQFIHRFGGFSADFV
uniref:Uncharacterized protein n=1 Tax=Candidatus Methanogaster sp. ANME-2c ERB4 TaxID=2759911 RepID=A0A7G9YNR9_9EURY|nr:hypothetical protein BGOHJMDD_00003 [Methanosarcinales archaeon ANME-2c ERB4]